jgi:DNA-binding CsgD family transcriptional regulator
MLRIAFVGLSLFCCLNLAAQVNNDSLISVLREEINRRDVYVNARITRIDKLGDELSRANAKNLQHRFEIYNHLYHQYKTFIYDSAFRYAKELVNTAFEMKDPNKIGYARVKLGFILISSGMFKETFDSLKRIEVRYLSDSTKIDYYRLLSRAYSDLNIYNNDQHYRRYYQQLDQTYLDSAIMFSPRGSYHYYYLGGVKNIYLKNFDKSIQLIDTLLRTGKLTYPQMAVNYYDLSNAYRNLSDEKRSVQYMVMSSLSDLRAATKETAAMHTLAKMLFERGDTENAYIFIKQALNDAEFYGARQRKVEIMSILPLIASAQLNSVDEQRKVWFVYSAGLTVLILVVVIFSIIISKQLKKLKLAEGVIRQANRNLQEINNKLMEADKIKEEYIGYYFSNNSQYIDKIESFRNSIDQKLQSRKVDDIRYLVNTINPVHEREELYFNFDKIFLKLFPDFVSIINSYFDPENRIVVKDGQLLNTELRIFALIRLGIHDAEKIAKILGYSVNTIYSYKNRVKSKSVVPNDEFEDRIMEINGISNHKS